MQGKGFEPLSRWEFELTNKNFCFSPSESPC